MIRANRTPPFERLQNVYIESLNGRLRAECLNEHWFTSLGHARVVIEAWRREYNEERPKKGLGGLTPATYAKTLIKQTLPSTPDSRSAATQRGGVVVGGIMVRVQACREAGDRFDRAKSPDRTALEPRSLYRP